MAVPAPQNPLIEGVDRGALAAVNALLQDRIAAAGGHTVGVYFGAIPGAAKILASYGVVGSLRSIAYAVLQTLGTEYSAAQAYQRELQGATIEAVIPYSPGLQPGEFRAVATVDVSAVKDWPGGEVRLGLRQIGIPQTRQELLDALYQALQDFAAAYEIQNINRYVDISTLQILRVEAGG